MMVTSSCPCCHVGQLHQVEGPVVTKEIVPNISLYFRFETFIACDACPFTSQLDEHTGRVVDFKTINQTRFLSGRSDS